MLSREDNERLTRVGRGTPMGEMLRELYPGGLDWKTLDLKNPPQFAFDDIKAAE